MELLINNFAKIKEAKIVIDGITVIAGENNTGKSTVGKILFSIFNALSNVEEKILQERMKEIDQTNRVIIQNNLVEADFPKSMQFKSALTLSRRINAKIRKTIESDLFLKKQNLDSILEKTIRTWEKLYEVSIPGDITKMIEELCNNIVEVLELPEEIIVMEIITRYFNNVFHSQINTLYDDGERDTFLTLKIKGKEEKLHFNNNHCKGIKDEIGINHKAIYIDNPFIIDELSGDDDLNPMNELLRGLLVNKPQDSVIDGVIESVRAKEKLNDIYATLQTIVEGDILINNNTDEYYLKNADYSEPISLQNLSTGMKSFVILKMLLEKGSLKDKDVVILDEPEIHLHPQWQIAYAELIVLLQKYFDLSVIVTTHSPYFVDAINLFSRKYGTDSKCNYYLSSNVGNRVTMDLVTDKIDLIYKKMASPIQMLDTLRYELNNN